MLTTGLSGYVLNAAQPAVPAKSNPPPPSSVVTSWLRSQTDINPVPPIPKTRRPSDIAAFGLPEDTN